MSDLIRIPYTLPTMADFRAAVARRERELAEMQKDPAVRAAVDAARAEATKMARLLKEEFGARRVRLFGSLARGDATKESDIDLAVEGIDPGSFFRASARAALLTQRRVDIIDVADASPLLRLRIDQDGVDLP